MRHLKKYGFFGIFLLIFLCTTADAKSKWWKKILGDSNKSHAQLNSNEIGTAFKQALSIGAQNVIAQIGTTDGFNKDKSIHIPLPKNLEKVRGILKKVGMSATVDDLELKLNRAAETATPIAKDMFLKAIKDMTFEDVKKIYAGGNNSATNYFKNKMTASLSEKMHPIVAQSLSQVGAVQSLNKVMNKYDKIPFVSSVKPDLTGYVVEKGMDGIFYYLAKQEAEIRTNPMKQTTALLRKVFKK